MATRKSIILAWAEDESIRIVESIPSKRNIRRSNNHRIYLVCKHLVSRRRPIMPSAKEISELSGAKPFEFENFPSAQTIYNDYGTMLGIWRKAYRDINNIENEPATVAEELLAWDPAALDTNSQYNIRSLQRLCRELNETVKGLKQLVTDNVPINADRVQKDDFDLIADLSDWSRNVTIEGFEFNEFGLVVTRNSPPGTIVMDKPLFDGLARFADAAIRERQEVQGDG